ncbi:MAG TPA: DUF262 domain-containing protein [Candidatus Saccharimonadales bacterium]|nr:DUF262 domain-containing protein [Candidatus Saccharimonadales bacterium]
MKVILDALIPRDDFEVTDRVHESRGASISALSVTNLREGDFFFSVARKPDFQRETNEWDTKKIIGLINSFIDGDLIPAIILWKSPNGYTFVIDGAHRLSAIAAWVNDDYGDGKISRSFFSSSLPNEQIEQAERTRRAIRKQIGSFAEFELATTSPEKVNTEIVERSRGLAAQAIQVQWVGGDAAKAEESFFKINQEAVAINKTELQLLKSRKKPDGIASRAISRSGTGHKYWATFTTKNQSSVEEISKEIHDILFAPPLKSPVKTLDLPIGGKLYSQQTLALILELTHIANSIDDGYSLEQDSMGAKTLEVLTETQKLVRRINSIHPSSLGLHPAVYFYSLDGRYKPASFYIIARLIYKIQRSPKKLKQFTSVRSKFEEWLLKNDYYAEQIIRKARSASSGYPRVVALYELVIGLLDKGLSIDQIARHLESIDEYSQITKPTSVETPAPQSFTTVTKSAVFMQEALSHALKCSICGGYIHKNSITIDHFERKSEGGRGSLDNGKLAHPYCNTTYKN